MRLSSKTGRLRIARGNAAIVLIVVGNGIFPQSNGPQVDHTPAATFNVPVDEVSLTFHAQYSNGMPATNLKLSDLTIYDNEELPWKILLFERLQSSAVRAGILFDTSESMSPYVARNRAIATTYVKDLLRSETDSVFVEDFGDASRIIQPWTNDSKALAFGIEQSTAGRETVRGGTALLDTLFSACFYQFGKSDRPVSGNLILLFSDGEDNASHVDVRSVVDICQKANTAIYAIHPRSPAGYSSGPGDLAVLTSQTGGRAFELQDSDAAVSKDLASIDSGVRNQYWLVYRAANLKHDGLFHHVYVGGADSEQNLKIDVRAGYYAPTK